MMNISIVRLIVFLVVLSFFFVGCLPTDNYPKETIAGVEYKVITVEGCQYFYRSETYGTVICHKGNCNNPIHQGLEKPEEPKKDQQISLTENEPMTINIPEGAKISIRYGDKNHMTIEATKSVTHD